jgi:hypothetical protein
MFYFTPDKGHTVRNCVVQIHDCRITIFVGASDLAGLKKQSLTRCIFRELEGFVAKHSPDAGRSFATQHA